jgi:UrcA family protein
MTFRLLPLALSAAMAGSVMFAAPAVAETQRVVQLEVQYDANVLATASGAETVLQSLQNQAATACGYTRPVTGSPRIDDVCAAEVVARAVMQINHPELTRAYSARAGEPARVLASLR